MKDHEAFILIKKLEPIQNLYNNIIDKYGNDWKKLYLKKLQMLK
jgi:hypothetical protein